MKNYQKMKEMTLKYLEQKEFFTIPKLKIIKHKEEVHIRKIRQIDCLYLEKVACLNLYQKLKLQINIIVRKTIQWTSNTHLKILKIACANHVARRFSLHLDITALTLTTKTIMLIVRNN